MTHKAMEISVVQNISKNRHAVAVMLFSLLSWFMSGVACADTPLGAWRNEITNVRKLAENDAPFANKEALRLQKMPPVDATPADKARVLNLLARTEIYTAQAEASASHSQQALEIAKRNGDRVGQAEAYLNISLNSVNQAKIDSLIDAAPRAMEALQGVDRPDLLGEAMLRAAMMYRRVGQLDESVTLCMQAMDIAKRSNDPMALLYAAQCLGISYDQSERHVDARVYFTQMRDLARIAQAKQLEADAIGGIASSAGNMGDWRMAVSLQREAIALYREAGVPFNIAHGLYQLASNLRRHGLLAESLKPFGETIAIYEQHPNKIGMWWALNARSANYQEMGRLALARTDAERAYALAKNIGLLLYQSESAKRMAAVNAALGDHKRAYQFSVEADDLADKISREKTSARMVELAQRYQNESKQKKIDELSLHEHQRVLEQRWLLTVLGGSILLLAGATFAWLRLRGSQHLLVASNAQLHQSQEEVNALNAGLEHRVQAQTAELRQQTRYLRTLIDTLPVSIWLKDTEGRYLAVNARTAVIRSPAGKSYTLEQMIGKTDEELLHGDSRQSFSIRDFEVMQTRQHKTYEIAIPGEDGSIAWREVDKAPVIDEDGSVLGTVGFSRDISERKRYEQMLLERAELERRQSQYFASVPGLFATVEQRADGSYAIPFASSGIRDLYGLEPEAVMKDIGVFVALAHPDDVMMTFETTMESARNLTPYHVEYRINHPKKGVRWIAVNGVPQAMPDGGVRWDGFYHDITERKAMENSLRNSQYLLTEAQRIAHVGSWELNLVDNILSWSEEIYRIFEIDPQEFGASYEAFMNTVHPDDRKLVDSAYKASLEKRERYEIEHRLLLPDGRVKYVFECCESYYDDNNGKPLRSLGTVQDITERKLMEHELIAREQQLRALAESSPGMMGAFYARPDGSICMPYVSANIEELFGLRPQDIAVDAAPLLALNHPADAQRVKESIAESARTMTVWHEEYRTFHPTKGLRWMESNTMPTPHPEGGVIWYGHVHDITERKRIESILLHSQEMLADAQKLALLGSWDWYLVTNRVEWSEMAYDIYTPDKRPAEPSFEDFKSSLHPDDLERVVAAVQSAFDHDTPFDLDHRVVSVSKGVRTVHAQGNVFRDTNGKPVRMVGTVQDITERKQLEIDLWDSRDFLDTVIDSVSDPIFVKDRQHRWTLLNDAFCTFLGQSRETLLGKSDYDFFPEDQADEFWAKDELVFNAAEVNLNEERFTAALGEERYIQTKKTPFVSGDGEPMLVGVIRDITDLKRYQEAREAVLVETQRLAKTRSEFLAHMSHELRTPLNGILGYTQILQRDPTLSTRNADALNVIRQSGEHLLSLVEDILDLARIEVGRFKLDLGDISLATFLRVVVDIVSIRATQKGLEFITDVAADLPAGIRGDDKRLRQVLLNLLSNAVKFTEHGKVVLHVSRTSSSRIAFVIEDTGIGIAANELETIFLPFEQSGDVQQRFGGAGLGLSISRQLVRLMGGDILVESSIGKGSTFRFELELPAVEIDLAGLLPLPAGNVQTEAIYADEAAAPLIMPSIEEMKNLHRLAQLGNMRDIVQYAERISVIDPRYQPFAERLRRMAEGFQSKAILAFVERYLHDTNN